MVVVDNAKNQLGFTIRKKLKKGKDVFPTRPNCGINGIPKLEEGVYKMYHFGGKPVQVRCKLYSPVNHKRPNQLAWQAVYRASTLAWNALTETEKDVYRKKAFGTHMTGCNVFKKQYLLSHTLPPGPKGYLEIEGGGYLLLQNGGKIIL